jgi:hypothetical protein
MLAGSLKRNRMALTLGKHWVNGPGANAKPAWIGGFYD